MNNATVTIYTGTAGVSQTTGMRTETADPEAVITDAPCTFQPGRASRRTVNKEGLRQFNEVLPSLMLITDEAIDVKIGDTADVTTIGFGTKRFTVASAVYDLGITGAEWVMDLQGINTPS